MFLAAMPGSSGTLNIGAPAGQPPVAPGTLIADRVSFANGTGELVFNHTSRGYRFSPAITGAGSITLRSGSTILAGDMSAFSGSIQVEPTPRQVAGYTTPAAQQATVQALGDQQMVMAVQSRATPHQLLGLTRPIQQGSYVFVGGILGSSAVMVGGQVSLGQATLIGGISQGAQDDGDLTQSTDPTLAAAARFEFDDPVALAGYALHPFAEIGGWVTPDETLTRTRVYDAGLGLVSGHGSSDATAWGEYARAGLIWKIDDKNQLAGFAEFGGQGVRFGRYTEAYGQNNPFPATVDSGTLSFGVLRFGASWTADLQSALGQPWTLTLAGALARPFSIDSGLSVTEAGLDPMTDSPLGPTWGELGAQVDAQLTKQLSVSLSMIGCTGSHDLGSTFHGGLALNLTRPARCLAALQRYNSRDVPSWSQCDASLRLAKHHARRALDAAQPPDREP